MRFGFAVKILGTPDLKSNDARRWQNNPHLRVSIRYLCDILRYLDKTDIRMYRMSSDLAPYITHPDMPQFHSQIDEALGDLVEAGRIANEYGIRLSFHPSQYIVLNSIDTNVAALAAEDLRAESMILDAMGQGRDAVVVTHVGGLYGDREGSKERFIRRYEALHESARNRLVLENDETSFSVTDVLEISEKSGIPVVFDYLHHMNNNPEHIPLREAVERSLITWPDGVKPKMHYSSPRTELREQKRKNAETGKLEGIYLPPLLSQHSDYLNPFEFCMFMEHLEGLSDFDIMLESKAKDLALISLRKNLKDMGSPLFEIENAASNHSSI
ncbi:MAG: UV DNA damage repair endonuclease UvsE [Armatimonadota bacterium]